LSKHTESAGNQTAGVRKRAYQISWTKDAKSRSKAVPRDDIIWIKEMTGNYRKWRTTRASIRKLEDELRILVDKLEDDIIKKTEKLRKYF